VLAATARVGESGWYILGREVARFEGALAGLVHRRHAIGCGTGLDALEIALRAAGVPSGAKVLTTPLSAFATTLAIVRAGAVPGFVDVDEHGIIDLARCREALAADAGIRAMVPVHLYGHSADLTRLEELQQEFGISVVEDCAQSIGAAWRGAAGTVGTVRGDEFYPTKNLGALATAALSSRTTTRSPRVAVAAGLRQTEKYVHDEPGLNSRLDELHAAVLADAFLPEAPALDRTAPGDRRCLWCAIATGGPPSRSARLGERLAPVPGRGRARRPRGVHGAPPGTRRAPPSTTRGSSRISGRSRRGRSRSGAISCGRPRSRPPRYPSPSTRTSRTARWTGSSTP
jgi:hypothetical protein